MRGIFNMKNLNASEKSRGAVVIAYNTDVDYVSIAVKCAKLIEHYLGLPTALITDSEDVPRGVFSHVIHSTNDIANNKGEVMTWRNANRYQVYELSPFEETVLLDSDYLVMTEDINLLWATEFDYKLMYKTQGPTVVVDQPWNQLGLPYVWATIVAFRKTPRSRMLFDLVGRIQRNYDYYCKLYNINSTNFRNDYAFAIANSMLNGYTIDADVSIPWTMFSLGRGVDSIKIKDNFLLVRDADGAWAVAQQDIHVHDKQYLQSQDFDNLVEALCQK